MQLAADIRRFVDERPKNGYRRIAALIKRRPGHDQCEAGLPPDEEVRASLAASHRSPDSHGSKTVGLLRSGRTYAAAQMLWSSPVGTVRSSALDCHGREAIGWVATTACISGEMIWDMTIQCDERRFGSIRAPHRVR